MIRINAKTVAFTSKEKSLNQEELKNVSSSCHYNTHKCWYRYIIFKKEGDEGDEMWYQHRFFFFNVDKKSPTNSCEIFVVSKRVS